MSRNGKIARLPRQLRETINQRLENNEPFEPILAWLNPLPEVQAMLKDQFEGIPVSKQNLSEWRKGGYHEWEFCRDFDYDAAESRADGRHLEDLTDDCLADSLGVIITARYNSLVRTWLGDEPTEEFKAKLKVMRVLVQDVSQMRRWEHSSHKLALAKAQYEDQKYYAHQQEMEKLEAKLQKQKDFTAFLQELAAAKKAREASSTPPKSQPVQASVAASQESAAASSQSSPVKPSQTTFTTPPKSTISVKTPYPQPVTENKPANFTAIPAAGDSLALHPETHPEPSPIQSHASPPSAVPTALSENPPAPAPVEAPTSPCIGVCKNDGGGFCTGCLRSIPEVLRWPVMTPEQKRECLEHLALRRRKKESRE